MTRTVETALVVGGGIGGMSAAIALRQVGIAVDLIDIDPEWRVQGAGITITGPTLRAFARLGLLDLIGRDGFFFEQIKFFNVDGQFLNAMESPVLEAGLPPAGGILRPTLHNIMSQRTLSEGTQVRLGLTVDGFVEDETGVDVAFSDKTAGRYDLVVGADGANSDLRTRLLAHAPPLKFTGQGCWRLLADRSPEVTCAEIYFGPNNSKVGISPCSPDQVYLYATVGMPGNPYVADADLIDGMRAIIAPFGGHIREICDAMGPDSSVNYRPLFGMLVKPPWNLGRVGLIGDAVHATTPHLASGAGITVEDGIVLAEEMSAASTVSEGWAAFAARRFERARLVVENSLEISRIEQGAGSEADVKRLMGESAFALAQPI
jgi:2-polyprenyl-6-methoxyphenol hydroxylase-like FAD-dependent oxidoreductase